MRHEQKQHLQDAEEFLLVQVQRGDSPITQGDQGAVHHNAHKLKQLGVWDR